MKPNVRKEMAVVFCSTALAYIVDPQMTANFNLIQCFNDVGHFISTESEESRCYKTHGLLYLKNSNKTKLNRQKVSFFEDEASVISAGEFFAAHDSAASNAIIQKNDVGGLADTPALQPAQFFIE